MRICVLQSAYPAGVNRDHDPGYHPEFFVPTHSFEHRWVHKKTARAEIDAALQEKFDVYFNLMWGKLWFFNIYIYKISLDSSQFS